MTLIVLTDEQIDSLIELPKAFDGEEVGRLWKPTASDGFRKARIYGPEVPVGFPFRGEFFLFSRFPADGSDLYRMSRGVTMGLGVHLGPTRDSAELRLVRCNGPHGGHRNKLEGGWIGDVAHVHRATERYLRCEVVGPKKIVHDGYAEPTEAFVNSREAFEHLQALAAVQLTGTLFAP